MELKPGVVAVEVPKTGATEKECLVCTGPMGFPGREREMAMDAFLVGMALGVRAMITGERDRLCVKHETKLRENLSMTGCAVPDVLNRLGIEFKVADKGTKVGW